MPELPPPPAAPPPGGARIQRWLAELVADLDPSRRRRALFAGVAIVVVAGAVGALWLRGAGPPPALDLPPVDRARPAGAPPEPVYAHAAGAVARPGLYRLPAGARVADLVEAAGGPLPDGDVDQLNLAARVSDGDRVYVPRRGEVADPSAAGPAGGPAGAGAGAGARLDLNAATEAQLDELPGIGPATASAIVQERTRRGRFKSVEELLDVRGIGPAKLEQLRELVRV